MILDLYGEKFDTEKPESVFANGDCVDAMKKFPDKYFDLAIVDPPYGNGGGTFKGGNGTRFGGKFDRYKGYFEDDLKPTSCDTVDGSGGPAGHKTADWEIKWDVAPTDDYFSELFRVSKNQIIWGGNYFNLPPTRCFIVWRKTNVTENFSMAMAEYAWTSFNDNAKVFDFVANGTVEKRFHPTQKPIELYEWVLNKFAKDGDLILDTHVGSGSSLIACRETGHKYVGFEISKRYYNKALKRVNERGAQMNIFDFLN